MEDFIPAIIVGLIVLAIVFVAIYFIAKQHRDFIAKASHIREGMTVDEVLNIMQCSATTAEETDDTLIAIWEKNQWKGIQHGGTLTRSIKVTFVDGRVKYISTKNLDKSVIW